MVNTQVRKFQKILENCRPKLLFKIDLILLEAKTNGIKKIARISSIGKQWNHWWCKRSIPKIEFHCFHFLEQFGQNIKFSQKGFNHIKQQFLMVDRLVRIIES